MEEGLTPRLAEVARHVLPGRAMADVGTDHALLPAALVRAGTVPSAIAIDNKPGPLARARSNTAALSGVELRLGHGLQSLAPGEVATVTLAGMGGGRVCALLDAWPHLATLSRAVLQPNTDWIGVRRFIMQRRLALRDETMVEDRGHVYLVLVVDPRTRVDHDWTEDELLFGPRLLARRPDPWCRWMKDELARLRDALTAARDATPESKTDLTTRLERFERHAAR